MPGLMDVSWRQLAAQAAQTDQQAARLLRVQETMDGVAVAAGSADGAVEVSVDRDGAVTALSFADHAMRLGPAGLAAAVLEAIRAAKQRIGPRFAEIVASSGADEATVDRVVGRYRDRHPDRFGSEPVVPQDNPDEPGQLMQRATDRPR